MPENSGETSRSVFAPAFEPVGAIRARAGFTLLEVMVALAIMATVIMTVIGSVNYHLGIIAAERDSSEMTILGRYRIAEMEEERKQGALPDKSEGSFAPGHPDLTWTAELVDTQIPAMRKLVLRVRRSGDKQEVALERYILK